MQIGEEEVPLLLKSAVDAKEGSSSHLGDLQLASFSIAYNVVLGFSFGLMLGMATALETVCGQAFGAKKYHMLGVYLQRSWVVLLAVSILLLPIFIFATPILLLTGQPRDIAEQAGTLSIWLIPLHFSFGFQFSIQRFLQCQRKNIITAYIAAGALTIHIFLNWVLIYQLDLGINGATFALNISWWMVPLGGFSYIVFGGCPLTWTGFSMEAFSGLWEFLKLSAASGVMLCLEYWYYRILILLGGKLKNATVAINALSVCMSINGWEIMIPFAFLAGTGVRVANELGAGDGKAAKFATIVSVVNSMVIGLLFWALILAFHDKYALIFTSSIAVINAADKLAFLLAFTILLNSIQPVLSGVAIGSGWQAFVAYANLGCYYLIGIPLGVFLGWVFNFGILGIWAGMIGGTAVQTLILSFATIRCDWDKEALKANARMNKVVVSN
ncbi:protein DETOXIFICATION 27-like isoform X2 [Tasmannia lanceolata]|uniref:protein DETOXIFICATION 27-like isoform X2 n=1 Tax=Tasmannia lanceolata TaxID=3420 RepID=UPI004063A7D8